ncbi:UDP-2,3-diacylglucosamine diphosphatase LpxI [Mesorhizobium sp. VK25A]|uniref:UDP-2,3-diacylglucosamine diphosphatase LpxI n=1 Tax=Mesorhizobium vachelliae TaxID=3072309 RepID=A0ABU4ZWA4_9HYPH|nr:MULTISPECIES: UDP-2,3-diacylglucosamine diphosphatase LpxI [unclassified Mesorhizobium]MDX8529681.1 UDP-2,3-diacylglucosamine diphosphatase LpxI [Mesorhizobium sp. VK25D]MDX8545891.1 UDP-2,3-diacylglucosamine diphosphatase LpxI [Mesorhizobium sp. VK25A]
MTRSERAASGLQLAPGSRVGIIAGGGSLPVEVAEGLARQGHSPFIIMVEGEVDREADFARYEQATLALENVGSLVPLLKRQDISHLVLAGEIRRRPRLARIRPALGLLAIIPSVILALARGDDGLLKVITRGLERRGITVVGAHEFVPELAAGKGTLTVTAPKQSDWRDIEAGRAAAKAIGALDIGQAAIAIGGRAIALEGVEGTAALLERTRELRGHGRLAGKTRGVLVKCAKPGQELRADLPSIGPQTVEAAHAAGLAGIALEAGRSLILEGPETLARANALGLFIVGLPATELADGEPANGR